MNSSKKKHLRLKIKVKVGIEFLICSPSVGVENVNLKIGNLAESTVRVPGERMWDILQQGEGSTVLSSSAMHIWLLATFSLLGHDLVLCNL